MHGLTDSTLQISRPDSVPVDKRHVDSNFAALGDENDDNRHVTLTSLCHALSASRMRNFKLLPVPKKHFLTLAVTLTAHLITNLTLTLI